MILMDKSGSIGSDVNMQTVKDIGAAIVHGRRNRKGYNVLILVNQMLVALVLNITV